MKHIKALLLAAILILYSATSYAASLEVSWTANTESDLASYKIYQTFTENVWGVSTATILAPLTTYTIPNVLDGTSWIALTAIDTAGNESPKSDAVKVIVNVPPGKPTNIKVIIKN